MSTAALRWIRTLPDSASRRASTERDASSTSGTHVRRVSLHPDIPDSAVVWPETSAAADDEPRFPGEERPTRVSSDFGSGPTRPTPPRDG
ncbi:MAG TPA: hypothetical protein VMI54_09310 [Polyangiaceae bacterium]|nr:hypothetical protein [Polyangiaceae bacterium]